MSLACVAPDLGLLSGHFCHPISQSWDGFGFEPGVLAQPMAISRGRMGENDPARKVFGPVRDCLRERLWPVRYVPGLGICADDDFEAIFSEMSEERLVPQRSALWSRWQIAVLAGAWVAETHWHDRNERRVVELFDAEPEPLT